MIVLLENLGFENKREISDAYKQSLHVITNSHNTRIKNILYKVQSGKV